MGEMPAVPDNIAAALVNAAQSTGLFGLRAAPVRLTPPLLRACRAARTVHHEPAHERPAHAGAPMCMETGRITSSGRASFSIGLVFVADLYPGSA